MSDIQLPAGFTPIDESLPTEDRAVLAIRKSGYISAGFEVVTARYQPTYRPRLPWRDLSGDSVMDDGTDILGWRYADEWLLPSN